MKFTNEKYPFIKIIEEGNLSQLHCALDQKLISKEAIAGLITRIYEMGTEYQVYSKAFMEIAWERSAALIVFLSN